MQAVTEKSLSKGSPSNVGGGLWVHSAQGASGRALASRVQEPGSHPQRGIKPKCWHTPGNPALGRQQKAGRPEVQGHL